MSKVWVVAGCYDGSLHGWCADNMESLEKIELSFAYSAHSKCIRCIKLGKKLNQLATGASDESLKIYDISEMKELVDITDHNNTVNDIGFIDKSHIISGCENGEILYRRIHDFQVLHSFKGQKDGPCRGIAIHPSGNLFLSISSDNSLRLWDIKARRAASRNRIEEISEINLIVWNSTGTKYCAVCDNIEFMVFDVEQDQGLPEFKFKSSSRINSVCFLDDKAALVALGLDNGSVIIYDFDNKELVQEIECDTLLEKKSRVRFIQNIGNFLFVALSTNDIVIFEKDEQANEYNVLKLLVIGAKAHVTAFEVGVTNLNVSKKRKRTIKKDKDNVQSD